MATLNRRECIVTGMAGIAVAGLGGNAFADEKAMKASEVRDFMRKIGGFSEEHLAGITDELLAKFKDAERVVGLDRGKDGAEVRYVTSGNHFTIGNGIWSWLDGPGSQCYMANAHTYKVQNGASYRYRGKCPNGAGDWYEINVV